MARCIHRGGTSNSDRCLQVPPPSIPGSSSPWRTRKSMDVATCLPAMSTEALAQHLDFVRLKQFSGSKSVDAKKFRNRWSLKSPGRPLYPVCSECSHCKLFPRADPTTTNASQWQSWYTKSHTSQPPFLAHHIRIVVLIATRNFLFCKRDLNSSVWPFCGGPRR